MKPPRPLIDRRALLQLLAVPGGAWLAAARAGEAVASAVEIEAGVYVVPGAAGEVSPANLGRVGNAGFIVGREGVVAVDTGVSFEHGQALLRAIAEVTDKPVRLALVTHAKQEFLFGAAAFQARGIPVHMHRQAAQLMASRCEGCLKTLRRELGESAMRGTVVFRPDQVFDESHAMDMIGRPVLVQYHGHSSGPGDVAVFDLRSGALFAGGMVDHRRVPDVQDSDLPGWKRALAGLRTLRLNTVVGGHGPATTPDVIDTVERYLLRLEARVAALLKQGAPLSEVPDATDLPEYRHWDQYDTIHRRNASIVFLRLERALMLGEPATGGT
jgi:glyoxylase-like metal-dependent hydrolase (beta-lactamase superfamily II)